MPDPLSAIYGPSRRRHNLRYRTALTPQGELCIRELGTNRAWIYNKAGVCGYGKPNASTDFIAREILAGLMEQS